MSNTFCNKFVQKTRTEGYKRFVLLFSSDLEQTPPVKEVLSSLQVDFLLPYSQLLLSSRGELPDCCLALGLRAGPTRWYVFSEAEELRQTRTELAALVQVREQDEIQLTAQVIPHSSPSNWVNMYIFIVKTKPSCFSRLQIPTLTPSPQTLLSSSPVRSSTPGS